MIMSTGLWKEHSRQPIPPSLRLSGEDTKIHVFQLLFIHDQWTPQRVVPELQKLFFGQVSIWYIDLICSVFWANLLPTEGARLGCFLFLVLSSLQFPCTVVFHFRLHYWRKNWEIKGFADGARTCACYLIMSQVLRGKKKSFWDQSCMKDLDFSCRGKREQKKKKSVCQKNSHKICKILKLKVLQCRGTSGLCEQARLGPLGTVLGRGLTVSQANGTLEMRVEGTDPQNRDGFGQD